MNSFNLLVVVIIILIIGIILVNIGMSFLEQIPHKIPIALYDDSFTSAITKISSLVPQNETLIVSDYAPVINFFTRHPVKNPHVVYSKSLFDYMAENKHRYLVVFEPLLMSERLEKNVNSHFFKHIANFTSQYSNVHLYQRK
jgi:hypothetical protein